MKIKLKGLVETSKRIDEMDRIRSALKGLLKCKYNIAVIDAKNDKEIGKAIVKLRDKKGDEAVRHIVKLLHMNLK